MLSCKGGMAELVRFLKCVKIRRFYFMFKYVPTFRQFHIEFCYSKALVWHIRVC